MMLYYYIPRFSRSSKLRFHMKSNEILKFLNPDFVYEQAYLLDDKPTYDLKQLNPFLSNAFYNGSVTELLRFTDRIGKHFGVMSQPIFAQFPDLYQHALSLSSSLKIKRGITKYVLRKAFEDLLPKSVLQRREKMGLVAPNNIWMKEHKDLLLSYITADLDQYFQVTKMRDQLSKSIDAATIQENYKIFRFISFAIWHKVWVR